MEIREDLGPLRRRSAVLFLLVFVALAALHLRLVQLQLIHGGYWRRMAENNRLRQVPLPGSRGRIYDRRGWVLADNRPAWELLLFPDDAKNLAETVLFLARADVADAATLHARLGSRRVAPLAPMVVGEELSWSQVAWTRAHQSDFPELSVVSGFRRHYPEGPAAAHAVGYLRPTQQEELDRDPKLKPHTLVGATGVEELRNAFLSGTDGERWVVVSAVGRQLGVVRETLPTPGMDLVVTLDIDLQRVAANALADSGGAVVALDARTGAVRVLYSAPSFDPNIFVGRLSRAEWEELRDDPQHLLQNRCLQGVYPPGSTIKPILAQGGLSDGSITPGLSITCLGAVVLHGHRFRCWRRSGHGRVDLLRSLEVSCDSYYYLLGQRLEIDNMAKWLRHFGFGEASGLGLAGEREGLVGTPEWSRRVRRQPWYPGEAVSVSIGQGPLLATSMQLARAFAALANGGWLVTPYLVEGPDPSPRRHLDLDPDQLSLICEGLRRVVHGGEGTARGIAGLPIAGKTGTAQVVRLAEDARGEDLEPHLRHHAWFVGWAPLERPELVVSVLVEHGGGGGSVAAPVAARIFEASLDRSSR